MAQSSKLEDARNGCHYRVTNCHYVSPGVRISHRKSLFVTPIYEVSLFVTHWSEKY